MSLSPVFAASLMFIMLTVLVIVMLGTLGQGTSPLPSSKAVRRAIISQLNPRGGPILDLGAGYGSLALAAARHCPARTIIGYERAWLPWLAGWLMIRLSRQPNLIWRHGNIFTQPLPDAQDWICYLGPAQMQRLTEMLAQSPHPPCQLISNTFRLPGYSACEQSLRLHGIYQTQLYIYQLSTTGLSVKV